MREHSYSRYVCEQTYCIRAQHEYTRVEKMFEILISNLQIIAPTVWGGFALYGAWYFTRAKRLSPLTKTEAKQLWTIHKQDSGCKAQKWRQVKRGKLTVGFECECGYKHVQKRPLVTHAPTSLETPEVSPFDRLHTTHKTA